MVEFKTYLKNIAYSGIAAFQSLHEREHKDMGILLSRLLSLTTIPLFSCQNTHCGCEVWFAQKSNHLLGRLILCLVVLCYKFSCSQIYC